LREFLDLAVHSALGDGLRVRYPLTGFVDKRVLLIVFQQNKWLAIRDRRFPFDGGWRSFENCRMMCGCARLLPLVVMVTSLTHGECTREVDGFGWFR